LKHSLLRSGLTLGLLSAVGPFAIDMYLPGLPAIGHSLGASVGAVQMSLMAFIIAIGVSQLLVGPWSDIVGRKPPIYAGLVLFGIASVGCALSTSIEMLIVFRVLQGLGACAGMVIPRAIVRDLHTGPDAVRLMSLLMLVFSVSPLLAPLSGSFVVSTLGWRAVFWVILAASVFGIGVTSLLQETRLPAARINSTWGRSLAAYGRLLTDGHFMGVVLISAFGVSSFFVYLANSSFVFINHYHLSPTVYSLFFAVNAAAFIGATQCNGWLTRRYDLATVVRGASIVFVLTLGLLLALVLAGVDQVYLLASLLFVAYSSLGTLTPNASVLALENHGAIAGTASALMGAMQLIVSSAMMALTGVFANGKPLPMVAGITVCAICTWALSFWVLKPRSLPAAYDAARP
jgi:DHA1 family bicyclomycin/chloramphenicol resistance-like MFS transporter